MDKNNGLNERAERIPQRTVNLFEQVRQKIILIRDCQGGCCRIIWGEDKRSQSSCA